MEFDQVCINEISEQMHPFLRLIMACAELYSVLRSLKCWGGEFQVEILQEQYSSQFYSSHSTQRHQEHEYASVTFSAFQIIIKRFVATESGGGAVLSWPMPDGNILYLLMVFLPFLSFLPTVH